MATFVLSTITSNVWGIDRAWTLLPTIYTVYFAFLPLWPDDADVPRFEGVLFLPVTPQGMNVGSRLRSAYAFTCDGCSAASLHYAALNLSRRYFGCYGSVTTRGAVVFSVPEAKTTAGPSSAKVAPIPISSLQHHIHIIHPKCAPPFSKFTYVPGSCPPTGTSDSIDFALFITGLFLLAIEFTADNQPWAFQNYKQLFLAHETCSHDDDKVVGIFIPTLPSSARWPFDLIPSTASDAHRGFITKGLWAWSRHLISFASRASGHVISFVTLP
jgi:hypothetical protein